MALQRAAIAGITDVSYNNLASSLTAVASSSAITVSPSANVVDHEVVVSVALGAITPTTATVVNVYVYGSADGLNWPGGSATTEVVTGTDQAITWSANGNTARFLGSIPCHTASITLKSAPLSIAAAFCGVMPAKYAIVIQNQTGVVLAATGHTVAAQEIYYT